MPSLAIMAVLFTAGILLASNGVSSPLGPGMGVVLWASALIWVLARYGVRGRVWLAIAVLAGGLRMTIEQLQVAAPAVPLDATADDRVPEALLGVVQGPVTRIGERLRFVLAVEDGSGARVEVSMRAMERAAEPELASHAGVEEPLVRPLPGDRVRVRGRLFRPRGYRVPGAVPRARIIRARGADWTISAMEVEIVARAAVWTPWRAAAHAHERAVSALVERAGESAHERAGVAVLRAMLVGDRSGLEPAVQERYRRAGVAHVLAVSGLHLAVAAFLVFVVVRRLWAALPGLAMRVRPALMAALVAAPAAVAYAFVTGGRVSTLRALIMVLVVLAGAAMNRRGSLLDALGLAALCLLMDAPSGLFDPGFQLSFAVTATLILVAGRGAGERVEPRTFEARHVGWRALVALARWLRNVIAVSLWATLATAPLAALAFGRVSVFGVLGNVVAVPMTELVLVPIGLLGLLLVDVAPALSGLLLDLAIAMAGVLDRLVAALAEVAPSVSVFPPSGWELAGAAAVWLGAVWSARARSARWRPRVLMAAGLALMVSAFVMHTHVTPQLRDRVRVTFLDVGQGDAAVIELPGGGVWMVDGGGLPFVAGDMDAAERRRRASAPGRLSVARFLAQRRISRIDVLVISHAHPDHYQGLHALVGDIDIGAVWLARNEGDGAQPTAYRELLTALVDAGATVHHPRLDTPLVHGRVTLTALAPRYLDGVATEDPVVGANDNSLVVRLQAFGRSILFAGDVEHEGEELLVRRYGSLPVDVVKVPHHGSRTSSTWSLVTAIRPTWAVISCGRANRFGFPAPAVVARWQAIGAKVVRTDQAGAVTVVIEPDGQLWVDTFD